MSLSHVRLPISHLGIKYRRRDLNQGYLLALWSRSIADKPLNSVFEADMYSSSITPAQVPLVRFELTLDLSPARVLSPAHIPFCYRGINTPGEIRTHTGPGLSRSPLPIGIREQSYGKPRALNVRNGSGRTRTFGVSYVTDLQSALLAAGVTGPYYDIKNRLRGNLPRQTAYDLWFLT